MLSRSRTLARGGARIGAAVLSSALAAAPAAAQTPTFELDTLLVTGVSRVPGGAVGRVVTLLDRNMLARMPVGSVSEAIAWVLGSDLQARSPAQADLGLRGASPESVLVLADGVRMSDPQTGHFDLDLTIPLERVERIEVLLGPASAQFGSDAVGGVVNVVTRSGGSGADLRAEAGAFGRWALAGVGGGRLGAWDVSAGLERMASDGHREGTDYHVVLVDGRATGPLAGGALDVTLGHGRRNFGAAGFYGPHPAYERTRTTTASARWTASAGHLRLTPRLSARRHSDDFVLIRTDPSVYRNHHASDQLGAEVTAHASVGSDREVALGGEWVRETLESNALGNRSEDRFAAFAELTTGLGRGRGTAGLRVDAREGFQTFVSPSVSASVPVGAAFRIRAQAGRAFRAPTWTERYYEDPANLGTPHLKGEKSWSVEAGVDVLVPRGALVRATVFRRRSRDLIDWARPLGDLSARWRTRNVETATFDGLELSGSVGSRETLLVTAYGSWLDLTTSEADGFLSKSTLRPLLRTVGATLERALSGATHVRLHLRDQTRAGETGVLTVDARVALSTPVGDVFVGGTNLTDASYADVSGLAAPGRALSLGVRTTLGR